jgi:hypothetical protein
MLENGYWLVWQRLWRMAFAGLVVSAMKRDEHRLGELTDPASIASVDEWGHYASEPSRPVL